MAHTTEYHKDGSRTDRYSDTGNSHTTNSDGSLRHSTTTSTTNGFDTVSVTRDPDGNVIDVQPKKG